MAGTTVMLPHAPVPSRRRSLGSSEVPEPSSSSSDSNKSKQRGLGGLLRRYSSGGGSQRRMDQSDDDQHQQQQQPMSSQSERGLGGLLRRAKSFKTNLDFGSERGERKRLDLQQQQDDEGPSGVASFLQQIEPKPEPVDPAAAEKEDGKSKGGMFRGFIKKAASFRSNDRRQQAKKEVVQPPSKPVQQQPPELEPMLVLTDGNHGKVVFQGLDLVDPEFQTADMHASLPDLVSASSCSANKSPVESPTCVDKSSNRMDGSFHTARTSVTARDSTLDDQYFLDFSDRDGLDGEAPQQQQPQQQQQEQPVVDPAEKKEPQEAQLQEPVKPIAPIKELEGEEEVPSSPLRDQMAGLFQRTKSGRIIIGGSSNSEGGTDTATTDDSSGDCSTEDAEEVQALISISAAANAKPQGGVRSVTASAPTCLQEITLPCLTEDDDEDENDKAQAVDPYQGLLDVVEEDEDDEDDDCLYEKRTCGSTSSMGSDEDMEMFEQNPLPGAYNMAPKREYDELELFYEEQTFEHVGGSLLLGGESELMTVHEYDEDYDSDEEEEEDEEDEEEFENEEGPFMSGSSRSLRMSTSLLPAIVEEGMDESCSSHDSY